MITPNTRAAAVADSFRHAPRFSGVIATALGLSVARQMLALATPLLTMHVFDSVSEDHNLDTLTVLTIAFLIALGMAAVMRAVRASLMSALAEDLARRLSLEALQAAVRSALGGSRKPGLAALQDTAELRRFLGGGTVADMFDMVAVPIVLIVLFLLHPVYFIVVASCCVMIGLLGYVLDRTTRGMVRDASDRQLKTTAELQGRLRQSDMLEGLGMLAAVVRRWQPAQAEALQVGDQAQARARAVRGLTEFSAYFAQGMTVVVGVVLAVNDQASPGSIIAAMMMAGMAVQPMSRIVLAWRDWAYSALAWRRLQDLFTEHAAPPIAAPDPQGVEGLWLREVSWTPPEATRPVIDRLSLHLPTGSITVVLGPNGAGKSTLLRLALGLLKPDAGQVTLDGQDTHHVDRGEIGARIGYLPQDVQLLDGSVLDNIARFGPNAAETAVDAARLAGAHDMIGRLPQGYAAEAGPSGTLSLGQRRMIGLARALHGKPRLLALDEPEAGLDRPGREAARNAVLAARASGACCLVVSHDPTLWAGQVDQVLRLDKRGAWSVEAPERARGEQ